MTLAKPVRALAIAAMLLSACGSAAAQRGAGGPPGGGGPGGPGGSGGAGGGMGAPGGPGGPGGAGSMSSGGGNMGNRSPGQSASITPRNAPQLGPPGRWWDDKKIARNLSLRSDQQRKMDDIFEAGKGNLVQLYANLQREEARLGTMSGADLTDETKVFAAIDRVAQARADVAKANAHILLQIRKELDATQLTALDRETAAPR